MTTKPQSTTEPKLTMTTDELFELHPLPWSHHLLLIKDANGNQIIHTGGLYSERGHQYEGKYLSGLNALFVELINSRISPASAAPVVDKDFNPPKNVAFEVWWKGQIARDFIHAALTELEKVSGPKLVAGEGSFAVEATAISAARRSLDSALSTLDGAKSMVDTAAQSQPLQCVRCKHYAETDPRGRCISVYYDAAGSLVYCGCKCVFPAAATAAPVEQSELGKLRQAIGWICDAADAAYNEDANNERIHEIFNIAAKAAGLTRRLPDEHGRFDETSIG